MNVAKDEFLIKSREHPQQMEFTRNELPKVFGLVARGSLQGQLNVYSGGRQVGSLVRSDSGVWEIDWHSIDGSNEN